MLDIDKRCQEYYQGQYMRYLQDYAPSKALNECLHDFLDQRPSGKKYSNRSRASGLAAAAFWRDQNAVRGADLASLALARVLHFDDAISIELLDHLAAQHADQLRWAIRFSRLFTRGESPLWVHLQRKCFCSEWQTFFAVCHRLLQQLEPFEQAITEAEGALKSLSLLELLSYLSVLAYFHLGEPGDDPAGMEWGVYGRIILRKLKSCSESDFRLSEEALGRSLKQHLSPMLFPQQGQGEECFANLNAVGLLVDATRELIDYEGSIDWFCFDRECNYRFQPGQSVIFNETNEGELSWRRTEQKSQLLWLYWMRRAVDVFAVSEVAGQIIGSAENHEANQLAYIKAIRSQIYLQAVFGFGERVRLSDGAEVTLHHAMLASELTTAFFEQEYLQRYRQYLDETGDPVVALQRLAIEGLLQGENRFPMTWSEQKEKVQRIRSWTVSDAHPLGDPQAAKGILNFWTSDLRALSTQLKQASNLPAPRLWEQPFYKIGRFSFQFPWIAGKRNSLTAAVNNLRRVNPRRPELRSETERVEYELARSLRERGFHVVVGYQPAIREGRDVGEVDLLACQDGVLILIELKSGYIRSTRHEVWLHRTNTLRKAARQLSRKSPAVLQALHDDPGLRDQLGLSDSTQVPTLHAWIVDTSIELDGEMVDGFRVVSREVIEVALRDEQHLLKEFTGACGEVTTLYPTGFRTEDFVRVIEGEEIWQGVV